MKSASLAVAFLVTSSLALAQSFTGSLDPNNPNDVLLVTFTLSTASSLNVQSWGYGGSSNAPGGTNAAGTVIAPGGFDPYLSLFSGSGLTATFLASNDDGLCPPGTASPACLDSTLHVTTLPPGTYTLALSVFENFSFAENLGTGSLGDLFIGLGNYYDGISNTVRTSNYAFDITASGLTVVSTTKVVEAPAIGKSFAAPSISLNGTTTLSFSISNTGLTALTGIAFSDVLPAGLVVASPAVTAACGGGTLTTTASSISLAGGTVAALGNCQIAVVVMGMTTGLKNNVTGNVTSTEGGAGNVATATISVGDPFRIRYTSNLTYGDSVINITNSGANGAPLNGPGFGSAGNVCVNVYAFSADEQLIACCSCLVTPDGMVALSVTNDLISNTLTGVKPSSILVGLIGTGAGPAFTASGSTACTNSASLAGSASFPLASGVVAWGTTIHAVPPISAITPPTSSVLGNFSVTETPFSPAFLSSDELASITTRCTNIVGNGSSFGICKSCRAGGLGADKL